MKQPNYTEEMTVSIISQYQNGESLSDIAEAIGKSVRSVRSKLVREGVYVAIAKPETKKVLGPSKKTLLNDLQKVDPSFPVNGMMGATKEAIEYTIAILKG
tara:strand:- start:707 stop:1009 length:303 start_codon:yes stop_codon:yes gene_type:complete